MKIEITTFEQGKKAETEIVTGDNYEIRRQWENITDPRTIAFFKSLGGIERRHNQRYTPIGYYWTELESISPDRATKIVRRLLND